MLVFFSVVLAFIFNYLGMCYFAFTIERHQKLANNCLALKQKARFYKFSGCCFLMISLVLCVIANTISMAILLWIMLLTLAGISVAMVLCFYPSLMKPLYL